MTSRTQKSGRQDTVRTFSDQRPRLGSRVAPDFRRSTEWRSTPGLTSPHLGFRRPFHSFPMRSPLARFCKTAGEVPGRGPRPAGLRVDGGGKNLLILLAFAFRPGFDEKDQLGARDTVSQLQAMGGQLVTRGLPFLARPGRQEFQFVVSELHGVPSST